MKRIAVIGSPGTGKSTFATELSRRLHIPIYHLDSLYWNPGWVPTAREDWRELQESLVQNESWIIDGNYGGTMDVRLNAADTVIFLDLPRLICVYRALKRAVQYNNRSRPDMGEGCTEKLNAEFLDFLIYIWKFPKEKRPDIIKKLENLDGKKQVITLSSRSQVAGFTKSF